MGADADEGGGMRGSDAAGRSPGRTDHTVRKETRITAHTTTDEAQITRAEAYALEQREAAARLGLSSSTDALTKALERNERISGLLEKSQEKILELSVKLAEASGSKGNGKKQKRQIAADTKVRLHAIDARHASIRQAVISFAPIALPLAPHVKLLADRYFPTILAAAKSGDQSPQAALIRLFVKLQDPEEESDGHQVLLCMQRLANEGGPEDWSLIEQALVALAAQSPAAKGTAPAGQAQAGQVVQMNGTAH